MNHKRGFIALVVAFVVIFCFGYVWHGMLMKSVYMETAAHWRTDEDFMRHFWALVGGQAVLAFAFTGLYISKVGRQSATTGLGYGIVVGIFSAGADLMRYATEPVTIKMLGMWIVGGVIELAVVGALVGAIYKPLSDVARADRP